MSLKNSSSLPRNKKKNAQVLYILGIIFQTIIKNAQFLTIKIIICRHLESFSAGSTTTV